MSWYILFVPGFARNLIKGRGPHQSLGEVIQYLTDIRRQSRLNPILLRELRLATVRAYPSYNLACLYYLGCVRPIAELNALDLLEGRVSFNEYT